MRQAVKSQQRGMRIALPFLTLFLAMLTVASCASSAASTGRDTESALAGVATTPTTAPPIVIVTAAPTATAKAERLPTTASSTAVTGTQSITTTATPWIDATFELSRYAGRPGETLTLRAEGFARGETVRLHFEGNVPAVAGEFQAGERGEGFVQALRIPPLPEGMHDLVATGAESGREARRLVSIVGFHPWVVLTSYAVHPGEAFGFSGSEFVPGEAVQVFLDGGATPLVVANANDRGDVRQETLIRATPQDVGKHELQFVGTQSDARLPVAFEVLPYVPIMELTSYAGPPGSVVGFTGHGFAPGETIHAYLERENGREELATFQADSDGAFANAGQFTVPANGAAAQLTISVEGAESRVPVSQRFGVLDLAPWAGLSAYAGPAGTQIDFHGKGFAAGETVDIFLGSGAAATKVATATADAHGEFEVGPFAVLAEAPGSQTFTFRGQNSRGEATVEFTVPDLGG